MKLRSGKIVSRLRVFPPPSTDAADTEYVENGFNQSVVSAKQIKRKDN